MKTQFLFYAVVAILLTSCSTGNNLPYYAKTDSYDSRISHKFSGGVPAQYGDYAGEVVKDQSRSLKLSDSERKKEKSSTSRMIIYNAYLRMVVENPDTTNKKLEHICNSYDGYVQTLGTTQSVIRVKSEYLDETIVEIEKLGKEKYKRVSGHDVTSAFKDYKIRLDNAQKARDKYLKLLEKAENVEAMLKVEKELERLNKEIDLIKGQMNRMEHLSTFSTITVDLTEKKKPGLLGYIGIGIYHSVKWLFVRN